MIQDAVHLEIRPLSALVEYQEAVALQKQIWGFEDIDLLPVRLFVVAGKVGGHSFGAFDGKRMVAFLLAIPGIKPGPRTYLHSHMMGVLPEYRNYGLGRRLKLAQRDEALARGIPLIEWTFDPLELKNAYLNIEKLGAIVRRYLPDNYGTTSSPLHGSLPTDRLVAEWWISSERVTALQGGAPLPKPAIAGRVAIEANVGELRHSAPERTREIQQRAAAQFADHFSQGLAVIGFERSEEAGTYLIGPWESK